MNKRLGFGLLAPVVGWFPLFWFACGGQETPPPAEPSGYQAPTADAGTDQGIGNMTSEVEHNEEMNPAAEGSPTTPLQSPGAAPGTTGMTSAMGSGGTAGTGTGTTGNVRDMRDTTTGAMR